MTTTKEIRDWIVLDCACTQILGFYDTEQDATTAASALGNCSFAYKLSDEEKTRLRNI